MYFLFKYFFFLGIEYWKERKVREKKNKLLIVLNKFMYLDLKNVANKRKSESWIKKHLEFLDQWSLIWVNILFPGSMQTFQRLQYR